MICPLGQKRQQQGKRQRRRGERERGNARRYPGGIKAGVGERREETDVHEKVRDYPEEASKNKTNESSIFYAFRSER